MFIEYSHQLRSRTWRSAARHVALTGLSYLSAQEDERSRKPRVQFLYLHHVFNDEEQGFRHLLLNLKTSYTLISYSEAVQRVYSGAIDKPYLTISFDDGFKNCLQAARIMREVGASACFFICPPIVGVSEEAKVAEFCQCQLRVPAIEFMRWQDIDELLSLGHEIGAHTLTHPNLAELPFARVQDEIASSRELLQSRLGEVKHFAWPFGRFRNASEAVVKSVYEAGFVSCASGERGCHVVPPSQAEALCLRRDHVMANWPSRHVTYFLNRNSKRASSLGNTYPKGKS